MTDRFESWSQKLLDFSARNRLLNIPPVSRQVLPLSGSDLLGLENLIASDQPVALKSIADAAGEKALNGLYHDARTELEESGVNTIFLALGTLKWLEPGSGANRRAYRAPIVMVPVKLVRSSMLEGVKMCRRDEDTTVNATLIEFLRTQFNLVVPGLDPLPSDESGVDVPRILELFRLAVGAHEGWEVAEDAYVGRFSFGKFVMWKDMTARVDELRKHPLVNHLLGGGGMFDDGIEVFPPDEVARHLKPDELFCPVSYDSSQLTAVLYSALGKTFVLHGPPGTGKSQTITNIIAHNLALGRRVLFVSEKKAALDVVKNRLDRIGLTPFCLELHSNKTEKGKFYEQLKAALAVPETALPGEWDHLVADFEKSRGELNAYIRELHRAYPNGLSAYDCLSRAIVNGPASRCDLLAIDCLTHAREAYCEARQAVGQLLLDFRGMSEAAQRELPPLKSDAWTPVFERQLESAVRELADAAEELLVPLRTLNGRVAMPPADATVGLLGNLIGYCDRRRRLAAKLAAYYRLEVVDARDWEAVDRRLKANQESFCLFRFFRNRALVKELSSVVREGGERLTVERLAADLSELAEYVTQGNRFEKMTKCRPEALDESDALRAARDAVFAAWPKFGEKYERLLEFVDREALDLDVSALADLCRQALEHLGELRGVMRYRKTLARAQELGVGAFADYIAANDDGNLDAERVYDDAYAARMLEAILARSPVLAEFIGAEQNKRIDRFRALDRECTELARKAVFARLAARLPRRRGGPCPDGSELGMVKRECEKKTRQKAVRQLLADSKTLIPVLKPCFLMSPLSVAQYLPVDSTPFDLIVFDEASQIPVWDAIGVIARGRQLVVVGDPKQMPPTSFFQKGESGEEEPDEDSIVDQESILDECLVAGVHSTYLNWHYRSRHEALISFSNRHYYGGKLCTFPAAANSPRLGVKFMFVEGGVFARTGRAPKVNAVEARALVDYVCTEVLKPDYRRRSLGIVTFSMAQQKLIEAMLDERRSADARLERLLPEDGEGAYFVKNLENVQGDESDVILFSVGYAPDETGRFTMNFGPLNLTGGERRLNVAVTRAKEQVIVFSSIRGSQIDAGEDGRTQAVGASHLKAFLEYAERGNAVPEAAQAAAGIGDGFGDVVARFLTGRGYRVDRNVGRSDYRIDVAVRDPDDPSRYLLGIECDGPSYAGQRTAQDRDVNRNGVLNGLGWHMCRVWSVDWAFDRERAEALLLKIIDEAKSPSPEPSPESAAQPPAPSAESAANESKAAKPMAVVAHPVYRLWKSYGRLNHERFYELSSRPRIVQMLLEVIAAEWPVYEAVARKRVAKAWGLTRMTEAVARVFDACPPPGIVITEHASGRVYWPKGTLTAEYREYRLPSDDPNAKRALEEIPPEELRNAMEEIRTDLGGCPTEALYRETLKLFGQSVLTAKARKLLDEGAHL